MRVSRRRARPAISRRAEVGVSLRGADWEAAALRIARARVQLRRAGRKVVHDPVPPSAAGGRVGIVDRQREALRGLGRPLPLQRGRDVVAAAAEAVEDVFVADGLALGKIGTGQRERRRGARGEQCSDHCVSLLFEVS